MSERRTDDAKLIAAVRILSRTIQTDDGEIGACLAEAATRLETLVEERRWISVDERLPEQGDTIWIFDGEDVLLCDYYRSDDARKPEWFTHWSLILQPPPLPTLAAGVTVKEPNRE